MHDATDPGSATLFASAYIACDYDELWRSFTRPESYSYWSSAPCREFATAPGGAVVWGDENRIVYQGILESLNPGLGLVHSFQFVGFGFEEPPTRVEIDLLAHGPCHLVQVRHHCTDAPRTHAIVGPVGWLKSISRLKSWLETGTPMPWPEEETR